MKYLILVILLIVSCGLVGRETMRVGEARRAGEDEPRIYARFRRRVKGAMLLFLLYVLTAFYEEIARRAGFRGREAILYFGGDFVVLFWLLILAARDFKETAFDAIRERQRITVDALSAIDAEIASRRKPGKKNTNP
ncbi:hypothetical protein BH09SUM1_BH09SUM1_07330 [soil metagenome]